KTHVRTVIHSGFAPVGIGGNKGGPPVHDMPSDISWLNVTLMQVVCGSTALAAIAGLHSTIRGTTLKTGGSAMASGSAAASARVCAICSEVGRVPVRSAEAVMGRTMNAVTSTMKNSP